jgi:hypothetical protein
MSVHAKVEIRALSLQRHLHNRNPVFLKYLRKANQLRTFDIDVESNYRPTIALTDPEHILQYQKCQAFLCLGRSRIAFLLHIVMAQTAINKGLSRETEKI